MADKREKKTMVFNLPDPPDYDGTDLLVGGARVIRIKKSYDAGENVEKVLIPHTANALDLRHNKTGELIITKNGIPLMPGKQAGTNVDVYPGTHPAQGDVKFAAALAEGDLLVVMYTPTRYAER